MIFASQLVRLKQNLLWLSFHQDLLSRYPLGLTNLADLDEGFPSGTRLSDMPPTTATTEKETSSSVLEEIVELRPADDTEVASENGESAVPQLRGSVFDVPPPQPELPPSRGNPVSLELLRRAVEIDRCYYDNQHVYPYIYLANYLHRHGDLLSAMKYWAEAARVIGQ